MSKVSEAKAAQGWRKKPDTCAGCRHFSSEVVKKDAGSRWEYEKEVNLRCSLGGFKTGKTSTCDRFEQAQLEQ